MVRDDRPELAGRAAPVTSGFGSAECGAGHEGRGGLGRAADLRADGADAVVSDPGLYERIALRRVHDGGVTKVAGAYLDRGRRTPDYLGDVFDRLVWTTR